MTWRPLDHDDPLRAAVRTAVAEIADVLAADSLELPACLDGLASVALFFGYLAHLEPDRFAHHAATADRILERAGESLEGSADGLSFFYGFPGVAWVGYYLRSLRGEPDFDVNSEADDAIIEHLSTEIVLPFDLTVGLVGLGVYALERAEHPPAQRCLELIVGKLAAQARTDRDGRSFWTYPLFQAPELGATFPDGCWDLGLAHGHPGAVAWLSRVGEMQSAAAAQLAREMLDGASAWLRAHRRVDAPTCFSAREAPGALVELTREGWCYGDAGVALALALSGHAADARDIAIRATSRTDIGVRDATFCHGAAGMAQIYGRLHDATGDVAFRATARSWLARALEARDEGFPAGFYTAERHRRVSSLSFLDGLSGIGLVLLAALHDVDPRWDRLVLLSCTD